MDMKVDVVDQNGFLSILSNPTESQKPEEYGGQIPTDDESLPHLPGLKTEPGTGTVQEQPLTVNMKVDLENQNGILSTPPNPTENQTPEGYGGQIPTDESFPGLKTEPGTDTVQGQPLTVNMKVDLENQNGFLSTLPNPVQSQTPERNSETDDFKSSTPRSSDRNRNSLNLRDRLEVIRLATTANHSSRRLAAMFNCGRTQITNTLRQRSKYLEAAQMHGSFSFQRKLLSPKLKFEAVNDRVEQWLNEAREQEIVVTGPVLQSKAREIAAELGFNHFQGSNGWLESFRRRNRLLITRGQNSTHTDNEDLVNTPDMDIPEVILEEDELDWKFPTSSSSATSTCHPSHSTIVYGPETFHVISLREALRHLEDLKTLAEALEDQNMLQVFTTQETVIKNLIVSRLESPDSEI